MNATVRSMTGYGRGEHIAEERKFTVEMKSVNHRYNDMTIKLPRSLASLEDKIKKRIMRDVFRGKTDVYISFETFSAADVEVKLNETLAAAYIEKLNLLEEKFGLTGSESKLELVAKFPDVVTVEKAQQEEAVTGSTPRYTTATPRATQRKTVPSTKTPLICRKAARTPKMALTIAAAAVQLNLQPQLRWNIKITSHTNLCHGIKSVKTVDKKL